MSPSLKAFLALLFVVVVGAILIQPILDAADTDVVATSPSEPTEAPEDPEKPEAPEPSPEPTSTPSPTGGLISGPFRTQPLFDPYPGRCLRAPDEPGGGLIAFVSNSRIGFGTIAGQTDPGPPGHTTLGRVEGLLGFDRSGDLYAAFTKKQALIAPPEGSQGADGKSRLVDLRSVVWSPASKCGLATKHDGSVLVIPDDGETTLVREGVQSAAFSPDGRRLAVVVGEGETTSVWVSDPDGRRLREVHRQSAGTRVTIEAWSPDGRTLYLTAGRGNGLSFVATSRQPVSASLGPTRVTGLEQCSGRLLGIVDGAVAEITRVGPDYLTDTNAGFSAVSCSPNGAFMAALRDDDLLLLTGDGSAVRDLTTDSGYRDVFVDWGPGGSGLVFGRVPDGGDDAQVWYIPEGGTARDTGLRYQPGPDAIDWAASPPTGLP